MDTVELLWKIEKRYNISILRKDAENMTTVKEICDTVMHYLPGDAVYEKVYEEVREIIAEQAGLDVYEIQPHQSITDDLGLD